MKPSGLLEKLILKKYKSIKDFENLNNINVSAILNKDISNIAFRDIIQICELLKIDINDFISNNLDKYL